MVHEENKASLTSFPEDHPLQSQRRQMGASMACPLGSHGLWARGTSVNSMACLRNRESLSFPRWNLNKDMPIYRNTSPAAISYGGTPTL